MHRRRPQDVQIVDVSQRILNAFEIVAPRIVFLGEKVFYDVTESFDADAKPVPGRLRAAAQGLAMQLVGVGPTLESQMAEDQAARPKSRHTPGQ